MQSQPKKIIIEKMPFDGEFYPDLIGQDLKESYPFECPNCNATLNAKPSFSMSLGRNSGGGPCTKCNTYLQLEIAENNDKMNAKKLEFEK